MPKQYRIRVRGKQRDDIDIELFAQALLMVIEDMQADQEAQPTNQAGDSSSEEHDS
jgi:hypothetical protein